MPRRTEFSLPRLAEFEFRRLVEAFSNVSFGAANKFELSSLSLRSVVIYAVGGRAMPPLLFFLQNSPVDVEASYSRLRRFDPLDR